MTYHKTDEDYEKFSNDESLKYILYLMEEIKKMMTKFCSEKNKYDIDTSYDVDTYLLHDSMKCTRYIKERLTDFSDHYFYKQRKLRPIDVDDDK